MSRNFGSQPTGFASVLEDLKPGMVITVTTSNDTVGPAQFVTFNRETGILTLKEFSSVTPSDSVTVLVLVSAIETIRFE